MITTGAGVAAQQPFPQALRAFLGLKAFAYVQSSFAQVLINVYFYRLTHDLGVLVTFNLVFDIAHTVVYLAVSQLSKEYDRLLPLRLGVVCQLAYLATILHLGSSVSHYVLLLGILGGAADGAYWQSDNLLKLDLTTPDNRLRFTTTFGMIKSSVGTFVPPIAALLVVSAPGTAAVSGAYAPVFLAAMAGAAGVLAMSFFLPPDRTHRSVRQYKFWPVARSLWKDRNVRLACYSTFLSEVPDVLPMLLGVYLYLRAGTELAIGGYQVLTIALVLASNHLLGRYVRTAHYKPILIAGGVAQCVVVLILLLDHQYAAVFIYGVLSSLLSVTDAPAGTLRQNALTFHTSDPSVLASVRVEFLTLKEIFDCLGKNAGYVLLLIVGFSGNAGQVAAIVLGCAIAALIGNVAVARVADLRQPK